MEAEELNRRRLSLLTEMSEEELVGEVGETTAIVEERCIGYRLRGDFWLVMLSLSVAAIGEFSPVFNWSSKNQKKGLEF